MKYLVTGGAGFIGSNIVEELLNKGEKVRVLDNFSTGRRENIKEFINDIELIEGDIRSYHTVSRAVKGVDIILHQAALPSVPRSINDPITSNEVNIGGTINILDAAREYKVKRIVYASSSSVYGDNPKLPKNEEMTPNPLSPYAVAKLAGENYCRVFSKIYEIETVCLRYFNVFGPRQDPASEYSAVIPKFIKLINDNIQPVIYGDGEQSRDFTYVKNVVNANLLASTAKISGNEIINIACGERYTLNTLFNELKKISGSKLYPRYKKPQKGDIKHSLADITKAKKILNFKPGITFRKGLEITFKNYLKSIY